MTAGSKTGGRKPGSPNKVTAETRARIEAQADPVGFLTSVMKGEAVERAPAKEGDVACQIIPTLDQSMTAARILADKLVPSARGRKINLTFPPIETPADIVKGMGTVVNALAAGDITPDEAELVSRVLDRKRAAVDSVELERRIAALEDKRG